jgi:hypothetical protein
LRASDGKASAWVVLRWRLRGPSADVVLHVDVLLVTDAWSLADEAARRAARAGSEIVSLVSCRVRGRVLEQEDGTSVVVMVVATWRTDEEPRCGRVQVLAVVPEAGAPPPHRGTYEGEATACLPVRGLWRRGTVQ